MTATSKWRGHKIEFINDSFIYCDTKTPVESDPNRDCGHCGKPQTKEDHDGCLGTLPSVMNACCGHGKCGVASIQFPGGLTISGEDALYYILLSKFIRRIKEIGCGIT